MYTATAIAGAFTSENKRLKLFFFYELAEELQISLTETDPSVCVAIKIPRVGLLWRPTPPHRHPPPPPVPSSIYSRPAAVRDENNVSLRLLFLRTTFKQTAPSSTVLSMNWAKHLQFPINSLPEMESLPRDGRRRNRPPKAFSFRFDTRLPVTFPHQ